MSSESKTVLNDLCKSIDELIKLYRQLLKVVRKEREILVSADLDSLNENNRVKEEILIKIRQENERREGLAQELAKLEGLSMENPRLRDFAQHFDGEKGERLQNYHSVLELLLKRVHDLNQENESLVESALANITGAMKSIQTTLDGVTTYERKGQKTSETQKKGGSGRLVSREA